MGHLHDQARPLILVLTSLECPDVRPGDTSGKPIDAATRRDEPRFGHGDAENDQVVRAPFVVLLNVA